MDKVERPNNNDIENCVGKAMADTHNNKTHMINGNIAKDIIEKQINILQLNTSNANFTTAIDKLVTTIAEYESNIMIISKSNLLVYDTEQIEVRKQKLPNFNFEDKVIAGHDKARVTMIMDKKLQYFRDIIFKDEANPSIVVKFKE